MDFKDLVKKYDIKDDENFKNDLFDFFLDKEIKTKKNELLNMFEEVSKQLKDISDNNKSKKTELGQFASKAAKEYANAHDILNIEDISGTGQNGRITKSDLTKLTKKPKRKNKKVEEVVKNTYCKGIKADGDSCDKQGVYEIGNEWYCGFHKKQGKDNSVVNEIVDSDDEDEVEVEVSYE